MLQLNSLPSMLKKTKLKSKMNKTSIKNQSFVQKKKGTNRSLCSFDDKIRILDIITIVIIII